MDPLAPLITALHNDGRLRVWSMVITVFGDLVQHRGGEISTARLGRILGRVGVEQGALRTALSRLRRDGWVERERLGRTSLYRLSAQGLDRFAPATTRIYAAPRQTPVDQWAMSLQLTPGGRQEFSLRPADEADQTADCLVVGELQTVSGAYRATLLSPAHRAAMVSLAGDLASLTTRQAIPLDAAAARMLLIHRWRRIVLRFPELPAELMPDDSPLSNPRAEVAAAYARLAPAAEAWLDDEQSDLPAMPAASIPVTHRFTAPRRG